MSKVEKAFVLAKEKHEGQMYSNEPYFDFHIMGVVHNVIELLDFFGIGKGYIKDEMITVALLHDVVEDSDVTVEYIEDNFGSDVAFAVDAITKRDGEDYDDYLKRVDVNPLAKLVKLEDIRFNLGRVLIEIAEGDKNPKLQRLKAKYEKANKFLIECEA